jgi:hypothetical protein
MPYGGDVKVVKVVKVVNRQGMPEKAGMRRSTKSGCEAPCVRVQTTNVREGALHLVHFTLMLVALTVSIAFDRI